MTALDEREAPLSVDTILSEYGQAAEPSPEATPFPEIKTEAKPHYLQQEEEIRAFVEAYRQNVEARESAPPAEEPPDNEDFDPRFLMGEDRGRSRRFRYNGHEVDQSADQSYIPSSAPDYFEELHPKSDDEEKPDEAPKLALVEQLKARLQRRQAKSEKREIRQQAPLSVEEPEETPLFHSELIEEELQQEAEETKEDVDLAPSWTRAASAASRPYSASFTDVSAAPADYATERDYEDTTVPDADAELESSAAVPASFKEYLFSLATGLLYRLRGSPSGTATEDEDNEDLGAELTPAAASKYYGSFLRSQKLRLRICAVLLIMQGWISLGLPVSGKLNSTPVASLFCLAIQLTIMLLCLDVSTGAVLNALRGKFGLEFMALLSCVVTSIDVLLSSLASFSSPHLPFCFLSSLSLTCVLLASWFSCRGLRKALRVPAIGKLCYTVNGRAEPKTKNITVLKTLRPIKGFVRRSEEAAPDETMFQKLCLPLLALVLLLSLIVAITKHNLKDIFYIFSALLCPAVPFAALLCFALPFYLGSVRIFQSGAAIAGWSGMTELGLSKNLIITDRDLFPEGMVSMDTVRIFSDANPLRIISYAGSMVIASDSGVAPCFAAFMERNGCPMRQIENYELLPGGGMRGVIDSSVILCGSTELMRLMNVRIPHRLVGKNSVLLAVDGVLYGIFNLRYEADPAVRRALISLMRSGRHPVFAVRDFNVTPAMLHDCFDVATDGYDFPPYIERFGLTKSGDEADSQVSAVICRDGLGPLSHTADTGRVIYTATRLNLAVTAIGAVFGVMVCFIRLLRYGGVSVPYLFFFMILWLIPVLLVSLVQRFSN